MDEYIKTLTEQIRYIKARTNVAQEVSAHILDQAAAYEESGISCEEAMEKAVLEMGDPVEVGVALDRIHRPQMNWKLMLAVLALSVAGAVVTACVYGWDNEARIPGHQCVFMAVGFMVIMAVNFIDYTVVARFGLLFYILMTIVFFVIVSGGGGHIHIMGRLLFPVINGRVGAMSALVYLYPPVFAGILYRLRGRGYGAVLMGIMLTIMTAFLSVKFSSSLLVGTNIFLIMIVMMIAAVGKGMFHVNKRAGVAVISGLIILPVVVAVLYMCTADPSFRTRRILAFFDRGRDRASYGYFYTVIGEILGSLELTGEGSVLGAGATQYITDSHMDSSMIPLSFMHSYGILAGVLLLALFVVFIISVAGIVRSQKNQLGMLVSASCFLVLVLNCIEGILLNLNLFPVTTVLIPFITRGGSVMCVYSVLIGLIMSVHRYEKVVSETGDACHSRWRVRIRVERQ